MSRMKLVTVDNTDFGVATVDRSAPDRKTEKPAIAAAPAFPSDPPTKSTCPKFPLFESGGRAESSSVKSRAVDTCIFNAEMIASSGEPMAAHNEGPVVNDANTWAGRGAVKVTTASAFATRPFTSPSESASAPEGMSTAMTGRGAALIASMTDA
jgi:hypothetical protein